MMEFLYYCPSFIKLPVSALVLLALAAVCAAIPRQRAADMAFVLLTGGSMALSLLSNGDRLLLAAGVFAVLAIYLARCAGRR